MIYNIVQDHNEQHAGNSLPPEEKVNREIFSYLPEGFELLAHALQIEYRQIFSCIHKTPQELADARRDIHLHYEALRDSIRYSPPQDLKHTTTKVSRVEDLGLFKSRSDQQKRSISQLLDELDVRKGEYLQQPDRAIAFLETIECKIRTYQSQFIEQVEDRAQDEQDLTQREKLQHYAQEAQHYLERARQGVMELTNAIEDAKPFMQLYQRVTERLTKTYDNPSWLARTILLQSPEKAELLQDLYIRKIGDDVFSQQDEAKSKGTSTTKQADIALEFTNALAPYEQDKTPLGDTARAIRKDFIDRWNYLATTNPEYFIDAA